MHAIIRQGDGKYYISAVYGYYEEFTATDDYDRYLEEIYKPYWIVWDLENKRLIRWLMMRHISSRRFLLLIQIQPTGS